MKVVIIVVFFSLFQTELSAQADFSNFPVKEKMKKGWIWAALPVIAYDTDQDLQLEALGHVFYYGDGSSYPEYRHTVYAECSWFTEGKKKKISSPTPHYFMTGM